MGTRKLRTQSNRQLGRKKAISRMKDIKKSKEKPTDIVKINLKGEKFKSKKKERFEDDKKNADGDQELIDFLKVSVEDNEAKDYTPLHKREYDSEGKRYSTYFFKYLELVMKYGLMVALMCMNFIALSLSLNCNAGEEFFKRVFSAIFAFFFGFVYILVNYYTYRVMAKGQICKMNKEKLFPFNA